MNINSYRNAVVPIDSRNAKFSLTWIESKSRGIGPEVFVKNGTTYEALDACGQFTGTTSTEKCAGLDELESKLRGSTSQQALVLGSPNQGSNWLESADITWSVGDVFFDILSEFRRENHYSSTKNFFAFKPFEATLLAFDVETGHTDHRTAWNELTEVDPNLERVGYLVTWGPYSRIHNASVETYPKITMEFPGFTGHLISEAIVPSHTRLD